MQKKFSFVSFGQWKNGVSECSLFHTKVDIFAVRKSVFVLRHILILWVLIAWHVVLRPSLDKCRSHIYIPDIAYKKKLKNDKGIHTCRLLKGKCSSPLSLYCITVLSYHTVARSVCICWWVFSKVLKTFHWNSWRLRP